MVEPALFPAAFIAGILMFLAPCTVPLVPAFLAFIGGVSENDLADPQRRRSAKRKILLNALAYVIGFSLVFILFGTFAAVLGSLLGEWRPWLSRAGGAMLVLFGLSILGTFQIPGLSLERRIAIPKFLTLGRWESSLLIGSLFALGWSPCIGPILGSILFLASNSTTALSGAFLLAIFSLGLALPFLLCALLVGEASRLLARVEKLSRALQIAAGIILLAIGILMLSGNMGLLITWGFEWLDAFGYDRLLQYL